MLSLEAIKIMSVLQRGGHPNYILWAMDPTRDFCALLEGKKLQESGFLIVLQEFSWPGKSFHSDMILPRSLNKEKSEG